MNSNEKWSRDATQVLPQTGVAPSQDAKDLTSEYARVMGSAPPMPEEKELTHAGRLTQPRRAGLSPLNNEFRYDERQN